MTDFLAEVAKVPPPTSRDKAQYFNTIRAGVHRRRGSAGLAQAGSHPTPHPGRSEDAGAVIPPFAERTAAHLDLRAPAGLEGGDGALGLPGLDALVLRGGLDNGRDLGEARVGLGGALLRAAGRGGARS
jgi:hypothetical protein